MSHYDVFNGDADGICALLQLRLAEPKSSAQLITGIKRDINLLAQVSAESADTITVLDVSLDKNRIGLEDALNKGAEIFYVDHHFTGDIPDHPKLKTIINTTADVCTSLLVNQYLNNQFIEWAIVGTFGDNLKNSAHSLCANTALTSAQISKLEDLGIYINYNGYGASLADLHFSPKELFTLLLSFPSPLDFIEGNSPDFDRLSNGYNQDMATADSVDAHFCADNVAVYLLPNEKWARRVSGVFGNSLANQHTQRAHAVLTLKDNGNYLVSIRAPLENKTGADEFCRQFKTGGGRAAAAGINDLPADDLDSFIQRFTSFYPKDKS